MTKHTERDLVWNQALQRAKAEESFQLDEIAERQDIDTSRRTIRDTLNTLVDLGWLAKETPHAHTWQPGRLIANEEAEPTEDTTSDSYEGRSLDEIENATDFEKDEVYFGTVDRFSDSGNGLIEIPSSHINVGPIDDSAKGETIQFRYIGGTIGRCLNEEYTDSEYTVLKSNVKSTESAESSESDSSKDSEYSKSDNWGGSSAPYEKNAEYGGNPFSDSGEDKNDLLKGKK